jgi:hypothetical protein
MRRPLDWVVVSISLTVLYVNRMVAPPDMAPAVQPAQAALATPLPASLSDSPFAYVLEDGTQEFLPALNPRPQPQFEQAHVRQFETVTVATADPRMAVYTWSSPVAASEQPAFQ